MAFPVDAVGYTEHLLIPKPYIGQEPWYNLYYSAMDIIDDLINLNVTNIGLNEQRIIDLEASDLWYTKTESDALFAPIVHNHDDRYYTETEIDTNIYTKAEVDALITGDLDDYYTKIEVDSKFDDVDNTLTSDYRLGTQIDLQFGGYYEKTVLDPKFAVYDAWFDNAQEQASDLLIGGAPVFASVEVPIITDVDSVTFGGGFQIQAPGATATLIGESEFAKGAVTLPVFDGTNPLSGFTDTSIIGALNELKAGTPTDTYAPDYIVNNVTELEAVLAEIKASPSTTGRYIWTKGVVFDRQTEIGAASIKIPKVDNLTIGGLGYFIKPDGFSVFEVEDRTTAFKYLVIDGLTFDGNGKTGTEYLVDCYQSNVQNSYMTYKNCTFKNTTNALKTTMNYCNILNNQFLAISGICIYNGRPWYSDVWVRDNFFNYVSGDAGAGVQLGKIVSIGLDDSPTNGACGNFYMKRNSARYGTTVPTKPIDMQMVEAYCYPQIFEGNLFWFSVTQTNDIINYTYSSSGDPKFLKGEVQNNEIYSTGSDVSNIIENHGNTTQWRVEHNNNIPKFDTENTNTPVNLNTHFDVVTESVLQSRSYASDEVLYMGDSNEIEMYYDSGQGRLKIENGSNSFQMSDSTVYSNADLFRLESNSAVFEIYGAVGYSDRLAMDSGRITQNDNDLEMRTLVDGDIILNPFGALQIQASNIESPTSVDWDVGSGALKVSSFRAGGAIESIQKSTSSSSSARISALHGNQRILMEVASEDFTGSLFTNGLVTTSDPQWGIYCGTQTGSSLQFATSNKIFAMIIDGDQQLGIGLTAPTERLDVNGYIYSDVSHGELYTYEDGMSVTTTVAGTYYVIDGWTLGSYTNDTDYITMDATNGTIEVEKDGLYEIRLNNVSFTSDINNTISHICCYVGGVEQENITLQRKIGTGGDYGSASCGGFLNLSANDVIDFRVKSDKAGAILDIDHGNFSVKRLGK